MLDLTEQAPSQTASSPKLFPRQKRIYVLGSQCYHLRLNATCQVPVAAAAEQYDRYSYFYTTPSNRYHGDASVPGNKDNMRSRGHQLRRWWSSMDSFLDTLQKKICPENRVKSSAILAATKLDCKKFNSRFLSPLRVSTSTLVNACTHCGAAGGGKRSSNELSVTFALVSSCRFRDWLLGTSTLVLCAHIGD